MGSESGEGIRRRSEGMEEERLEEMMRVVLKVREARCLQSSKQGRRWPWPKHGNTMIWTDMIGGIFGMRLRGSLVFYIFYPALVASNLGDTVTASSLATMWLMLVNILLTFIIGLALGWILIKITRPPQHLHALILGCCSAGNMGNLFFIIIPTICEESNNPFGSWICLEHTTLTSVTSKEALTLSLMGQDQSIR
ncbi:unnamed protein product, partial [Vitis vinifera]